MVRERQTIDSIDTKSGELGDLAALEVKEADCEQSHQEAAENLVAKKTGKSREQQKNIHSTFSAFYTASMSG